jgi:branched-chain amino acid transport system substrate-binding protein
VVHEEYVQPGTADFTAPGQRLIEALRNQSGRKIIYTVWAPPGNPYKILDLNPKRYGIDVVSSLNLTLGALKELKPYAGLEGSTTYYYGMLKNPINDYLIAESNKRFQGPPDYGVALGFNAAVAIVAALKKTGGNADAEALIPAMEDMEFDTPKGKIKFRKEDHQAMQSMFHVRIKNDPALEWAAQEFVDEIKPSQMNIPVGTWRNNQ